jgi:hypothetical protein
MITAFLRDEGRWLPACLPTCLVIANRTPCICFIVATREAGLRITAYNRFDRIVPVIFEK